MKYSVLKFFVFVGIIGIIASGIGVKKFEDERARTRAVANAYEFAGDSYSYDNAYEEIQKFEFYKTLCIAGVVASILLTSACTVAHVSGKLADEKKEYDTTNSPTKQLSFKEKLTELESLKDSKLITEKEYTEIRKEILTDIKNSF